MNSLRQIAATYRARGLHLLRLKRRGKEPVGKWGHCPSLEASDFAASDNLGVALGDKSQGLVDLDFDWPEAAQIGELVFSDLPAFGRLTSPGSHRVAVCSEAKNRVYFNLPGQLPEILLRTTPGAHQAGVLEIRGSSHYTMFPPSVHPSGEVVTWEGSYDNIPSILWTDLRTKAGLCAFLAVVLRAYPSNCGNRHDVCLALTGALIGAGLEPIEVDRLVPAIAQLAGDEEADRRGGTATATQERLLGGHNIWGLPQLCRQLNIESIEDTLRGWLGSTARAVKASKVSKGVTGSIEVLKGPTAPIEIVPGRLADIIDESQAALLRGRCPIYQRGGALVYPARLDKPAEGGSLRRVQGSAVLLPVTPHWLLELLARSAVWLRPNRNDELRPGDPRLQHALHIINRPGSWQFPVLLGIVEAPTLRADGSLLQTPGYDQASQLLFDPGSTTFPLVAENPTREDAASALDLILSLLPGFPFVGSADRSVAVSAILTALVRRSLKTAPLFLFDAPTAGTGKSMLAELVGILATGHTPAMMSQGKTDDEDEKRQGAALIAGDSIIVLDNCERPVFGDFLCSVLTQEFVQIRILGQSQRLHLPTTCMVIATGNNLTLSGDMTRRAVRCRLDAGCEQPDSRQFDFDPRDEAAARRPELVVAGLTILRAYLSAGKPCPLPKMGSFEDWNLIRESLVWLRLTDPADTCQQIRAADPRKADLTELLHLFHACYGRKEMTVSQMAEDFEQRSTYPDRQRLHQLLLELTNRPTFNARSIGRRLSQHVDRVVGDLVLRCRASNQGAVYWVEGPHQQLSLVG